MRRKLIWEMALLALVVAWAIPGCLSPTSPGADGDLVTRDQTVNLDDAYGGFNFGDEAPNFADPMLSTDYGPGAAVEIDDPMGDGPDVVDADRRVGRRYLMITWGNLDADSTIDFATDWSGSLTVDNGVVVVRRTILFDKNDAVLPRQSRDKVEWISHTRPHYDGLLVALHKIVPHDSTRFDSLAVAAALAEPMSVTFATGPLTVTISEENLKNLHRVVTVDDAGNAVAFNTITVMPGDCPSGFLAGQWKNVDTRPGGIFRGKWISHNGAHMGYLRGVYGPNSRGDRVFFGKWITEGGRFRGLLRGHYGAADGGGGWFEGHWIGRDLRAMGALKGVYGTRDTDDGRHRGFFRGRWSMRCRS